MKIHKLFPSLLYESTFSKSVSAKLNKKLLSDCKKLEEIDDEGKQWSEENYRGGYTSYSSHSELHKYFSAFTELEELLKPHVDRFSKAQYWDLGKGSLKMTSCWISRMAQHTYHPLHIHPLSVVSGTYYVKVPKHTSRLKIEDPRLDLMMAAPSRKRSAPQNFSNYIHLQPSEGRFYLFESWMRHEVPPNPVDGDRISVSFNFEWV